MLLSEAEIVKILDANYFGRSPTNEHPNLLHQDSRKITQNDIFICIKGEKVDGHSFIPQVLKSGASVILGSDEKILTEQANKNPNQLFILVPSIQNAVHNLAKAVRSKINIPVISLTGASGKTTTKDFLVHIISAKHKVLFTPHNNNNLWGVPLALVNASKDHTVCVLETGTNAAGEVRTLTEIVKPTATYTTSIGESHLEFLKNIEGVLEAETEQYFWMIENQKNSIFFINLADKHINSFYQKNKDSLTKSGTVITLSSDSNLNSDYTVSRIQPLGFEENFGSRFTINQCIAVTLPYAGIHNVSNALAAIVIASTLKLVSQEEAIERLKTATITGLRSEIFKTSNGCIVFNDSYNANPASMEAAMSAVALIAKENSFIKRIIAVVGDMKELGETSDQFHIEAGKLAKKHGFDFLFTCGEFSNSWRKGFGDKSKIFSSSEELLEKLKSEIKDGDIVLIKASHGARLDKVADGLR